MRIVIALSIIFLTFLYTGAQLSHGLGAFSWILLALMMVSIFIYPVLWRQPADSPLQKMRGWIHIVMALLSFVFVFTLMRDLLFLAFLLTDRSGLELYSASGDTSVWVISCLAVIAGVFVVHQGPRLLNVEIPIRDLPDSLVGTKIAQISDLHVGSGIGLDFVTNVVRMVQSTNPDLVVFTGDIADGDVEKYRKNLEPLRGAFRVPMYYVPGNHEYYHDAQGWFSAFQNLGMHMLFNKSEIQDRQGGKILIAGIVDPTAQMIGQKPDPAQALGTSPADIRILLAHQPGIAPVAAKLGYDLQLSGHTHGGQFFPWTLVIKGVHRHSQGLRREGRMWVYVNPGTGHWGPPVRLGTRAEVTVIHLKKAVDEFDDPSQK